jgi:hypothetical protein
MSRHPVFLLATVVTAWLAVPAGASAQPVDLLHAVRADVAVSSAYRDRAPQAGLLIDGDLETAWNSRTGDLAGAWIEVRLPAEASVSGIAMTVGFTHRTDQRDLFTGNQRVARVRVLREGQVVLAEHAFDTSSRELQTIPVQGAGGVWRVEVLAMQVGDRSDWRETCVSELRVMGTAPNAVAGAQFPRVAVGALPPPRAPVTVDPAQLATQARSAIDAFSRAWVQYEIDSRGMASSSVGRYDEGVEVPIASWRQTRRTALGRVADLVDPIDEGAAGRLRAAAAQSIDLAARGWPDASHEADLALADAAFDAVIARAADRALACSWSRARIGILVERVLWAIESANYANEMAAGYGERESRDARAIERLWERFQSFGDRSPSQRQSVARRLAGVTYPASLPQPDFTALQAELQVADQSCGPTATAAAP